MLGLYAVLFGLAAFVRPDITVAELVLLFGAYALFDGIFAIVAALRAAERHTQWWPLVLEGVAGIAAGVVTFMWPGITALALLYLIAAWAIATGVFETIAAIWLRRVIEGEWLLGLGGIASVVFGLILALFPAVGAVGVVWIVAAYALVFGILLIALGVRLRGWQPHEVPVTAQQRARSTPLIGNERTTR